MPKGHCHRRVRSGSTLVGLGCALAVGSAAMAADVINPHVVTDRTVDTSSVKAMVASLIRPDMSDQDKAMAIYNYVRRTLFHYRYYPDCAGGGPMDLINSVGYCLCTPTAGTQARLCTEAGLTGHVLDTPGHGSVCVLWNGKWHWMDAFLGGCVWDRDRKTLASLEEIVAEPSLLKRDNPSPVPLFPCGAVLYEDALRWEPDNKEYHRQCGPDDYAWTARATPGKHQPMLWKDITSLDITLRPGETYTRSWDHEPEMFFLFRTQERFAPPHHICGIDAERRDVVNWPYWKPYVKEITSTDPATGKLRTVKTGRYWANGRLTWSPRLDAPDALRPFARADNAQVRDGAIIPVDHAKPAVLEWWTRLPYMLQGGRVTFDALAGEGAVAVSIAVAAGRGEKSPAAAPAVKFEPLQVSRSGGKVTADLRPSFVKQMGTREYVLRLELSGASAGLSGLTVSTVFQHNMYALPQLMPGANRVTLAAANPEGLRNTRFFVEFAWEQDGKARQVRRRIDRSPFTFGIDVAGQDLPRMRYLTLSNEVPAE